MRTVKLDRQLLGVHRWKCAGITVVETVISFTIATIVATSTIVCYLQFASQAEWSAMSMAAQGLAIQRLEQARGARWDTQAWPQQPEHNEFVSSNFPPQQMVLDVPTRGGTNTLIASLSTVISDVSTTPPLRQVIVECAWSFKGKDFTNAVLSFRAPDN